MSVCQKLCFDMFWSTDCPWCFTFWPQSQTRPTDKLRICREELQKALRATQFLWGTSLKHSSEKISSEQSELLSNVSFKSKEVARVEMSVNANSLPSRVVASALPVLEKMKEMRKTWQMRQMIKIGKRMKKWKRWKMMEKIRKIIMRKMKNTWKMREHRNKECENWEDLETLFKKKIEENCKNEKAKFWEWKMTRDDERWREMTRDHPPQLCRRPPIHREAPHEAQVDAQATVLPRTVHTSTHLSMKWSELGVTKSTRPLYAFLWYSSTLRTSTNRLSGLIMT